MRRELRLVCALVIILVVPAISTITSVEAQKTRTIRLGFLGSTNLPNANTQAGGGPALFAARLAISQINAQTDLLPNTRLELINNNTNSDAGTGNFMAYDQIQNRGVVGIIGEYNSGVSVAIGYPSRFYKIPMVSYGSTSPDFTTFHSSQFPYFLRLTPSQNQESQLLAYLITSQGWEKVGLVYSTDSPGIGGAQSFQSVASKLNIQVVASSAFAFGASLPDVYFAMNNMKQSGATIILFIGAITDMQSIIKVCTLGLGTDDKPPLGMYGPGYQWIGLHSYIYTTLYTNATGGIVQNVYDFAQGMIGLQNFADVNSDLYKNYATAWSNTPAQVDLPSVKPSDPASMTVPGHFGYDSVYFYAHALDRMEREFGVDMSIATSAQKALFLAVLKNVTFNGVTGPISVDQNGDRFAPFDICNFNGKKINVVGRVDSDGKVVMNDAVPIEYMGGEKALDYIVRGTYVVPVSTRIGMTVITSFCLLLIFAAIGVVWILRERAVMKAASPPFVILMLLGCGLLLSSLYPRIYENVLDKTSACEADLFLCNLGYTLIVGSLLVKTYRVDAIFRMRQFQQTILTNFHLLGGLTVLILCQIIICLGLSQGEPFEMQLKSYDSLNDYYSCGSKNDDAYTAAIMSWRFFLLIVTAIYCFRIRSIPDSFNESKTISAVVYNLIFLSILLPIIDEAMGRGKGAAIIAYGASVFVISLVTSALMIAPKLYLVFFLKVSAQDWSYPDTAMTNNKTAGGDHKHDGSALGPGEMRVGGKHPLQQRDSSTGKDSNNQSKQVGTPSTAKPSATATPLPLPRAISPGQVRRSVGVGGSALSSVVPSAANSVLNPGSPVPGSPTSPRSPRVHVSRGVSQQLMQMLVQQLADKEQVEGTPGVASHADVHVHIGTPSA